MFSVYLTFILLSSHVCAGVHVCRLLWKMGRMFGVSWWNVWPPVRDFFSDLLFACLIVLCGCPFVFLSFHDTNLLVLQSYPLPKPNTLHYTLQMCIRRFKFSKKVKLTCKACRKRFDRDFSMFSKCLFDSSSNSFVYINICISVGGHVLMNYA